MQQYAKLKGKKKLYRDRFNEISWRQLLRSCNKFLKFPYSIEFSVKQNIQILFCLYIVQDKISFMFSL
jgi:hypothetical protein